MPQVVLFPNEYRELLQISPSAEASASRDPAGNWALDLSAAAQARLADEAERAVAQVERDYQALGRQIWLTRPNLTDEEYARLDAQHGDAERRIRVLSRVLAALLEARTP